MSVADTIRSEGVRVPSKTDELTLDEAIDWMENRPCTLSATNLLDVVTQYHADGMVGDDTYRANVTKVSAFLRSRV